MRPLICKNKGILIHTVWYGNQPSPVRSTGRSLASAVGDRESTCTRRGRQLQVMIIGQESHPVERPFSRFQGSPRLAALYSLHLRLPIHLLGNPCHRVFSHLALVRSLRCHIRSHFVHQCSGQPSRILRVSFSKVFIRGGPFCTDGNTQQCFSSP